ncbi:hypothetical protein SMICM17S_09216 [Streptomyces microflavus]
MPRGSGAGRAAATRVSDAVARRAARRRRERCGMDYRYQRRALSRWCRAPHHPNEAASPGRCSAGGRRVLRARLTS